jgi:hypothetical protein
MSHQKWMMWFPSSSSSSSPSSSSSADDLKTTPSPPPLAIYLGSHNFSSNAWGSLRLSSRRRSSSSSNIELNGIGNYELGVVLSGAVLQEMTDGEWESVVSYERPARRYGEKEGPWGSPLWAEGK